MSINTKRRATSVTAVLATLVLAAGCGSADGGGGASGDGSGEKGAAVAMPGYKNDGSFTQESYEGLQAAGERHGLETTFIDAIESPDDMLNAVLALAQKNGLVIGSPTELSPALVAAAKQFPDVDFVLTDGELEDLPNTSYFFPKWYGPAYVTGAIAATLSKTGTIGFIGGRLITAVIEGKAGFIDGAKSVNPDIKVVDTIASMSDSEVARNAAASQIDAGADVIWGELDSAILGLAKAVESSGKDVALMGAITPKCSLPTVETYDVGDVILDQRALIEQVVDAWVADKLEPTEFKITDPESLFEVRLCEGKSTPEIEAAMAKAMDDLRAGAGDDK